jgi:hypothetical protein
MTFVACAREDYGEREAVTSSDLNQNQTGTHLSRSGATCVNWHAFRRVMLASHRVF